MKDPVFQLCDHVRETAFALHCHLRHGHMEKVYENGLAHRLRKAGVKVVQQQRLKVLDVDGTLLGDYIADMVIEDVLLVELKACRCLLEEHTSQILGYLRACRMEHGLLVNFGAHKLEIKKFALSDPFA